jgi:hypothetical protein
MVLVKVKGEKLSVKELLEMMGFHHYHHHYHHLLLPLLANELKISQF